MNPPASLPSNTHHNRRGCQCRQLLMSGSPKQGSRSNLIIIASYHLGAPLSIDLSQFATSPVSAKTLPARRAPDPCPLLPCPYDINPTVTRRPEVRAVIRLF
jgi:hypothetical protein